MKSKVLRIELFQEKGHFRNSNYKQTEYIPTLPCPTKTTIIGFITYILGRRVKGEIKVGIVYSSSGKEIEFTRGEEHNFYEKMINAYKKYLKSNSVDRGEFYEFFKRKEGNLIMRHEVLRDSQVKIFISMDDEEELKAIYEAFTNLKFYMALGRKEDYLMPRKQQFVDFVDIEIIETDNPRELIKNNLKLKNTYIKVALREKKYEEIIEQGILMTLPSSYQDLTAPKSERVYIREAYVYLDAKGIYPLNLPVNICEYDGRQEVFTWL